TAVTSELPGFKEQSAARFVQRRLDVRAGVEETDLDRSQLCLHASEQPLDCLFVADIGADGVRRTARRHDLLHDAARLLGIAPCHADAVTSGGEPARHCGADRVSGANQQGDSLLLAFGHPRIPLRFKTTLILSFSPWKQGSLGTYTT